MSKKNPRSGKPRKFTGELGTPIPNRAITKPQRFAMLLEGKESELNAMGRRYYEEVNEAKIKKLIQLLKDYGVDQKKSNCWLHLALLLAEDFIPGFRVLGSGSKRGRKTRWTTERRRTLVDDVNEWRKKKHVRTAKNACRQLVKSGAKYGQQGKKGDEKMTNALYRQYSEGKNEGRIYRAKVARRSTTTPLSAIDIRK